MGDIADRAQAQEERFLAAALARQQARAAAVRAAPAAALCVDCDEPILPARRRALPQACRCTRCAAENEDALRVRARQGLNNGAVK